MAEQDETGTEASTSNSDPTVPEDSYWPERRKGKRPTRAEKGSWLGQTELIDEVTVLHPKDTQRECHSYHYMA